MQHGGLSNRDPIDKNRSYRQQHPQLGREELGNDHGDSVKRVRSAFPDIRSIANKRSTIITTWTMSGSFASNSVIEEN